MSKTNSNVSVASLLFVAPIEIAMDIPVLLFCAYVMVEIWGWWCVPAGLPQLWFWTAVATNFLYALVRGRTRDIVAAAEFDALYEFADGDFEFLLSTIWWLGKRRTFSGLFILLVWGEAFVLHRAVE